MFRSIYLQVLSVCLCLYANIFQDTTHGFKVVLDHANMKYSDNLLGV